MDYDKIMNVIIKSIGAVFNFILRPSWSNKLWEYSN